RTVRRSVLGLSAIYVIPITLLTTLIPWQQLGVDRSPFVTVLVQLGIPAAAAVMNFVVLSAALSSSNANLYLITRLLFSLARTDLAPSALGAFDRRGAPVNALLISSLGLGAVTLIAGVWSESAYVWLFSVSLFGALFVWLMIFLTHIAFKR